MLPILESGEETLVGGQAVMEGVMMRAPHSYCVAVRKPDGELVTEEQPIQRMSEKYPIFRFPILRGLGTLGQAMTLGVKALKFSANAALDEGETGRREAGRDHLLDDDPESHLFSRLFFFSVQIRAAVPGHPLGQRRARRSPAASPPIWPTASSASRSSWRSCSCSRA